ncbi:hypothetical protein [Sphingobacterium yanglingense]|uniref:Uncharacterized protein n=1 Tax=Sphingobacterium yanglingense TaxID=1437280 RepID=A0A4R6WF25_9SPHI|nr:hypothetical protein [Sphingobacterium yanglingense]TDQ73870.1 hypothetical protein CLV99_4308 [Sphingobacterium yanglingense]
MKREQIQKWVEQGYQILKDGEPQGIEGTLLDNVDSLNEKEPQVFLLADLLQWPDEELDKLQGFSDDQIQAMDS